MVSSSDMIAANHLANAPHGEVAAFIIVAVVFFSLATALAVTAGTQTNEPQKWVFYWRALVAAGLGFFTVCFIAPF